MAKEKTTETADLALPRETGSEKAATTCVACGGDVPLVTSAYGSTSPGACPKCWPEQGESQLEVQEKAAVADSE